VVKKNIELKNELKRLYREQPPNIQRDIFRLVVIDCSEAIWPTMPIWRSKLQEHSRKEGFPIYGDWTKRMLGDYHMVPGESNFLIIDKHGVIRYSEVGKIDRSQFDRIIGMLHNLAYEG